MKNRVLKYALLLLVFILSVNTALADGYDETVIEYDEALAPSLGLTGDFRIIDDYGLMYFLPDTLHAMELSVSDKADGLLDRCSDGIYTVTVSLTIASEPDGSDINEADIEAELLESEGITDPELMEVNGLPAVGYLRADTGDRVVMFMIGEGFGLSFEFSGIEREEDENATNCIIASIMSVA